MGSCQTSRKGIAAPVFPSTACHCKVSTEHLRRLTLVLTQLSYNIVTSFRDLSLYYALRTQNKPTSSNIRYTACMSTACKLHPVILVLSSSLLSRMAGKTTSTSLMKFIFQSSFGPYLPCSSPKPWNSRVTSPRGSRWSSARS